MGDMIEAAKFLTTGVVNTAVDFGVLNLFIMIFGISDSDPKFILFKALSYAVAATNSFILNKWWVFKNREAVDKRQVGTFAATNVIGLVLNSTVAYVVFHFGALVFPQLTAHALANVGALFGTAFVLMFNFLSYKFVVFKKYS
jgi:putative flippase GtrA